MTETKDEINTKTEDVTTIQVNKIEGQPCHICGKNTLTLSELEQDVPYFGKVYILSMQCESCGFRKTDVEQESQGEPCKYSLEINSEEDLNIRIVKSSEATVKIPRMITMEPGVDSEGFITNVEGLLNKIKEVIEIARDSEEDNDKIKKAKNQIKKLGRVLWGQESLTLEISDPTGNSAIISDRAVKTKL